MAQAMDPATLAAMPAGKSPPGVLPNLQNPYSLGPVVISVGAVLLAIMVVFVLVRIYTKVKIVGKFSPDDFTCFLAALGAILYYITNVFAVTVGHFGTHMWDLTVADVSSDPFLISGFFTNWPYFLYIAFAKITFFLLYAQLFCPMRWLRYSSYAGITFTSLFYLSIIIFTLVEIAPPPGKTWLETAQGPGSTRTLRATVGIACVGFVLDFIILVLPIAAIQQLQLSRKRKIGVMAVFLTGGIACIASILSIYYKWKVDHSVGDVTYEVTPALLTSLVEINVGVTAACMPAMSALLRHHPPTWAGLSSLFSGTFHRLSRTPKSSKTSDWSSRSASKAAGYANVDDKNGPAIPLSQYETARSKSLRTYVRSGGGSEGRVEEDDDGIHLRYEIEQQSSKSQLDMV